MGVSTASPPTAAQWIWRTPTSPSPTCRSWVRGPSISSVIVRAARPSASLAPAVRRAILDVNRGVAIPRIETMDEIVATSVADRRFELSLMVAFGAAAALLAALGVYGVVSYFVARRGREMAIRIALGARPRDIHMVVVAEGLVPVGVGVVAGLALSWPAGRAIGSLLFDVHPGDPAVMVAAAALVTAAALVACVGPARRAAATNARSA